jgi:hypothetical protein
MLVFAAACGTGEVQFTEGDPNEPEVDADTDADTDSDADTDATPSEYEIAIGGDWIDSLGIGNVITDETWTWSYPPYPDTIFDITQFENELGTAIVRDSVTNDDGNKLWGRFDWTFDGDVPYICHSEGGHLEEDAATSAPEPDRDDLTSGCRGFEWWALYPR